LVFERFTERGRQVVVLAQDEARFLRHNYIGTEHLLLGVLGVEEGLAARVLESLDVTREEVRLQVAQIVGRGDEPSSNHLPFTPRAKKVLELSLREAMSLGNQYIGTEHVLLGLVREDEGVACRILLHFGADATTVRNAVISMLSGPGRQERPEETYVPPPRRRQNWEFTVVSWSDAAADDTLNRLGADGWRLAGVVPTGTDPRLIFERPAQPPDPGTN
jgi:ATP-dependent Clp protease ATP-binding subunit ClpA